MCVCVCFMEVVQPYNSTDTATVWKNSLFISSKIAQSTGYDTKHSDGEVPVMLDLWGMRRIPSLPSPQGPLWPRVVAHDRVSSISQTELNYNYSKLNCLKSAVFTFNCLNKNCTYANWIVWNGNVYCLHWNYVLVLKWIVWNRTVYMYKNRFDIK